MNNRLTLGLAVALLGGVLSEYVITEPTMAQSQATSAKVPGVGTEVERRVDRIFAAYDKSGSPGCALGVIQNGNFVYRKAYGMGSLELGVPLSAQSVFYMGSVSKQFTAASIVLAAEQGFLSLDDNVRKYIPELPDYGSPITLRQMLHHASGLPDAVAMLAMSGRHAEDVHPTPELMDFVVRQKTLNFKPGEQYLYSNTNYFLLAEVVKRATGKSLPEFAAESIFRPLGMTHTRFYDDHTLIVPGRVSAYAPGKDGTFLVDWSTNYDMIGAGGLMSSVDDLLLWDRNFYNDKLGKGTVVKELQTPGVFNNGKQNNYGLGLYMGIYRGLSIADHDGGNFGYRTDILRFPQQRFTVIALCNSSNADPDLMVREVADIYLEKQLRKTPPVQSDPALFAGKYFDPRTHFPITFNVEGGNLVLQGHVLEAIERNRFEDPVNGGNVRFTNSNSDMMTTVTYNNGTTFAGNRIIRELHLDEAALASYVGTYNSMELDTTYRLSVENGGLVLDRSWNPTLKLQPIVPNEFCGGGMCLAFRRDDTGRVSGLSVFSGWDAAIRNENFDKLN